MAATLSTVRALIYWEYAKLIAGEAVGQRDAFRFVNHTFRRLLEQRISPSAILRENQALFRAGEVCVYCGATEQLQWDHIVSLALGGPDHFDNLVRACSHCNRTKADRDPYRWYASRKEIDRIPRLVLGKFLKLVFAEYDRRGMLDDPAFMQEHRIERITLSTVFTLTP